MEAAIYVRISKDRAGKALGVKRQIPPCTEKATALGWTVGEVYQDNDISASKNVARPQYERLIADIESGKVRALVVYDLDRLTRKPAELESFITLSDTRNVLLANVSGDVDLTTANGRMLARFKGAIARQESERIGERVKAQKAQRAALGLPMGTRQRVYGYNDDWTVNEAEAAIVRDVFKRYLAGESQNSLYKWMLSQGHKTVMGNEWNLRATSRLLTAPAYAGIYVFKGERIGKTNFLALIDEATFDLAAQIKSGHTYKPGTNARRYLLSSILICDKCKASMIGGRIKDKGDRYRCATQQGGCGNTTIKAEFVDGLVNAYMSQEVRRAQDWKDAEFLEGVTDEPEDTRLEDKDDEIAFYQTADLDPADRVALLKKARAERKALAVELVEAKAVEVAWRQPIEDYDGADLSVRRSEISRYIKYIFVKQGMGRPNKATTAKRLTVLVSDQRRQEIARLWAKPDFDGILPGEAVFDGVDFRDSKYDDYKTWLQDPL